MKDERGAAMLMVLVAITVLSLYGATFAVMVANSSKKAQAQKAKQKAFYVAQSGLMRGVLRRLKYPVLPNGCFNLTGSLDLNENNNGNGTFEDDYNRYILSFVGVNPVDQLPINATPSQAHDPNHESNRTEIKGVISTSEYRDTTGGRDVTIKSIQSIYILSPFDREIHAEGSINMESRFSTVLSCILPAGWSGEENRVTIFGDLYSRNRPETDYRKQCCGILWAEPCFFGRCGCAWWRICCCPPPLCIGWSDDMGTRYYRVEKNTGNVHLCSGYEGDCDNDDFANRATCEAACGVGNCIEYKRTWDRKGRYGCSDEAEGQTAAGQAGGPVGSGRYYSRVTSETPFPQFVPPPDPRLPGSGSGLMYKIGHCGNIGAATCPIAPPNGPCCSHMMKDNRYLTNVWCDGDLEIRRDWLDVDLGFAINGNVYVSGNFRYIPRSHWWSAGVTLSALRLRTDGDTNNATPSSCELPPAPGTLIIEKGDIHLMSSGTPDFGRVNLVAVSGNITLESQCGMRARGFYYAGGPNVDPITKKRTGGTITYSAGTWLTALGAGWTCDTLGNWLDGMGIPLHAHTVAYGGFACKDMKLITITPCNVISQNAFDPAKLPSSCTDGADEIFKRYGTYWQYGNTRLQVPEGFWHNIRFFNYRVLE